MSTGLSRPLLILDLDETIVFAEKQAAPGGDFQVGPYSVFLRPNLGRFLARMQEVFDLAVWTSSSSDYAQGVTSEICTRFHVQLRFAWSRDRCTHRFDPDNHSYYWVKDLKKVKRAGYKLSRVLMVDDTSSKLERNYGNHVCVREFTGSPDDDELLALATYLEKLAIEPDFRTIEKRKWRKALTHGKVAPG